MDKSTLDYAIGFVFGLGAYLTGYWHGGLQSRAIYRGKLAEVINLKASEVADAVLEKIGANHAPAGTARPRFDPDADPLA